MRLRRRVSALTLVVGLVASGAACGSSSGGEDDAPVGTKVEVPPTTAPPADAGPVTEPPVTEAPEPTDQPTTTPTAPVEIVVTLDRRVDDDATADFATTVTAVLTDSRGWQQAGFRFRFSEDATYRIVLAEPEEVDSICAPYGTGGRYSCQIGDTVALNADRWRHGVDHWPGSIEEYRAMLTNHEVGHLLGQHHPASMCESPGAPAAVMAQQSKALDGCAANAWPLPWEITCAASGVEPLAPPYEPDAAPVCGP